MGEDWPTTEPDIASGQGRRAALSRRL